MIARPLHVAVTALLLSGCLGDVHTLDLELTKPDGSTSTHALSGKTSWEYPNGDGLPFASWPDIANWGTSVDLGLLVNLYPMQPGTYATSGKLYIGADQGNDFRNAVDASITMHMERVTWTGSSSFPFRQEGRLEGTTQAGHAFKGRFTTSTDDCTDKVTATELCGAPYPKASMPEQVWSIDQWMVGVACPGALVTKYTGGAQLVIDGRSAKAGGTVSLPCVTTYANTYKSLCGASEDAVTYDGCKWSVAAFAQPGSDYAGVPPAYVVYAGTVGDTCAPKVCSIYPNTFTHVSGAGP